MAADRLEIYNGALLICGARKLASLSVNEEPRHLLDDVWLGGRGVRYCLEQAQWHFAMRASEFDYNPSITPAFGLSRAFTKPTDWVNTSGVFQDGYMRSPLLNYADETGYWFADRDVIYVRYVSDDVLYGLDYSKWPESFTEYVKAYFASKIIRKMPGGAEKVIDICDDRKGVLAKALVNAKNRAAMALPATFPSRGTWARARHAGVGNYRNDGGNTNSLIG